MRGYYPQSISDYTKEQCQEYLAKYPNSLNAEKVKKRLDSLTVITAENVNKANIANNRPITSATSKCITEDKSKKDDDFKVWQILIIVAVGIGLLILSITLWDWLRASFPILAGILAAIVVIRSIFFKD